MTRTPKRTLYPEVKLLVQKGLEDYKKRLGPVNNGQIADTISLSTGALSSFLSGKNFPSAKSIDALAALYEPGAKQDRYRRDLRQAARRAEAREASPDAGRQSLGESGVAMSPLDYPPIAGPEEHDPKKQRFFNKIFDRFWRLTGIKYRYEAPRTNLEIGTLLSSPEPTLLLSYFSTLDRSLQMRFWPLPIRVSLGAVIRAEDAGYADEIAKMLSLPNYRPSSPKIILLVLKGEVGDLHRQHTLDLAIAPITDLAPEKFKQGLEDVWNEQAAPRVKKIPVILVDELRAIHCLDPNTWPALPLATRKSQQSDQYRRELPQYFVSFACARNQRDLIEFMDEAWVQFLRTEVETTARAYFELYMELIGILKNAAGSYIEREEKKDSPALRFQTARAWTLNALQLDEASIEAMSRTDPWRPILERARKLMQEHLAADEEELQRQLEDAVESTHGQLTAQTVSRASEYLDIRLTEQELRSTYGGLTLPDLLRACQRKLRGEVLAPEFEVGVYDPAQDSDAEKTMTAFLLSLASMYEDRAASTDARDKILELIPKSGAASRDPELKLAGQFGGRHGKVLLAALKSAAKETDFVGGVCLHWAEPAQSSGDCELRYLYVLPKWRRQAVAHQLVAKAKEIITQLGGAGLVAYILPQVREGILFFFNEGFEFRPEPDPSHRGRLVLRWEPPGARKPA